MFVLGNAKLSVQAQITLANGKGFIPYPTPRPRQDIDKDTKAFARRIRLRAMFDGKAGGTPTKFPRLYYHNPEFRPDGTSAEVEEYLGNLGRRIEEEHKKITTLKAPRMTRRLRNETEMLMRELEEKRLCVTSADKNLGLVVTPIDVYNNAIVATLVGDEFEEIKRGEANSIRALCFRRIKAAATVLYPPIEKENGMVDQNIWKYLTKTAVPSNSRAATPYLLWKVHKLKILDGGAVPPSRMIVPSTFTITRCVSKHLDALVRPIFNRKVPYSLMDSKTLVQILETKSYPRSTVLATKDVTALYPNVDIDSGLMAFAWFLQDELELAKYTYTMEMVELIMRNQIVKYSEKYYRQIRGTAMGSPVAVLFANIWMHYLEHKLKKVYMEKGLLLLYKRLIDDIFSLFATKVAAVEFWREFNLLHPNVTVTGPISTTKSEFLDLVVHKGSRFYKHQGVGRFDVSLHQKVFNRYAYQPYHSYHPRASKIGWISSELQRAIRNSSNEVAYNKYVPKFFERLIARKYPYKFLKGIFQKANYSGRRTLLFSSKKKQQQQHQHSENDRTPFVTRHNPTQVAIAIQSIVKEGWPSVAAATGWRQPPVIAFQKEQTMFARLRKTLPT